MRSFFCDLTGAGEREDLEPSGVREDRTIPLHESMKTPEAPDELLAGSQVEMVRVREDDVRVHLVEILLSEAADTRARLHRHEYRGANVSVRRTEDTSACARLGTHRLDRIRKS